MNSEFIEALEALEKENAALQQKVNDGKNDYLRLMAEFETFRRRNAQEIPARHATLALFCHEVSLPHRRALCGIMSCVNSRRHPCVMGCKLRLSGHTYNIYII
jgi:hypothetical protein